MTLSDDVLITRQADVLSADELEQAYQRWEAPQMVSVSDVEQNQALLKVAEVEALRKEAQQEGFKVGYEEGYQSGHSEGLAAARHEIDDLKQQWMQRIAQLAAPLKALDEAVEQDLLQLSITLARQLFFKELSIRPEQVVPALRAALAALPMNDRQLKVFLHPQDVEQVRAALSLEHDSEQWLWLEDPLLTPGGVRLETADTTIDATVETRLSKLIEKMLGSESADV